MRGGHNRLPGKVKQLRGTAREAPSAPITDPSRVPPPPKDLSKGEKRVWAELAVQVEALGVYSMSDLTAFRLMVETVAETRHFEPRDPATARVRTRQVAAGLLARFGLDPGSRDRVARAKTESTTDPLDEFAPQLIRGGRDGA